MSNPLLFKFRTVNPINDEPTTNKMLAILVEIPNDRQDGFWLRNAGAGNVCLFRHESFPGKIIEYVQGTQDDSVTTLYDEHPMFATLRSLKEARNELITEIGRITMALPSTVAIYDAGRERESLLKECGTAQLVDVLAHFAHTDMATV